MICLENIITQSRSFYNSVYILLGNNANYHQTDKKIIPAIDANEMYYNLIVIAFHAFWLTHENYRFHC